MSEKTRDVITDAHGKLSRLNAAASDLLAVLKRLTADIDRNELDAYHPDWHDALKAIAKAEGGAA